MIVVHLMASPFVGGPERQMLGLARHLPSTTKSVFLSFAETAKVARFWTKFRNTALPAGHWSTTLLNLRSAAREVSARLRDLGADILTCSGYKPDVVGWLAARKLGIPVISVSHGWTAATLKVRCYEALDRPYPALDG